MPERSDVAKIFHNTFGLGISKVREGFDAPRINNFPEGDYFNPTGKPVFLSQLSGADKDKVDGFYGHISDKSAALRFGSDNLDDFSYWAWRSCGIVCLQMVFTTTLSRDFKTKNLVNEGLKFGGYDMSKDKGWFHESLANLARKYKFESNVDKFVPSTRIAILVNEGHYVLSSMKSETGGHLVLIFGFRIGKKHNVEGFWCHDPSDYFRNGESKYQSKSDFDKSFTRRVITLKKLD